MGALTSHPQPDAPRLWAFRYTLPAADLAKHDTVVLDGDSSRLGRLQSAKALNTKLVCLIQPARRLPNGTYGTSILAATYGGYDNYTAAEGYTLPHTADSVVGSTRGFEAKDKMGTSEDGTTPYIYAGTGSVYVLDMRTSRSSGASTSTYSWGAAWTAIETRRAVALVPNVIDGIYQDNLFTSNDGYATPAWFDASSTFRANFDTGMADRNLALQGFLSSANLTALGHTAGGLVIGGTGGPRQYWDDPATRYRGSTSGSRSWHTADVSMLEHVNIGSAGTLDSTIAGITRFFETKGTDGRQKHVVVNLNSTSSATEARFYLALCCVAGSDGDFADFWWYTGGSGAFGTLVLPGSATAINEMGQKGGYARNWLGQPLEDGQKVASGRWRRTFEHGTVYVNQSGSTWTPESGVSVANHAGYFVVRENGSAPDPPTDPPPTGGTQQGNVTTYTNASTAGSFTWTHTVAAGDDRILYVGFALDGTPPTASGVTANGSAMTKIDGLGTTRRGELWRIVLGDSSTATSVTIIVTLSDSTSRISAISLDRAGVDQSTPNGTASSTQFNASSGTVTPATDPGDTVINFLAARYVSGTARTFTWASGIDEQAEVTVGDSSSNIIANLTTSPAAASPATSSPIAWTSNRSDIARQISVAENAASSSAPDPVDVLRVENVGADSVTLGWEPSVDYVVRYAAGSDPATPASGSDGGSGTGVGVTVGSLSPGINYRFGIWVDGGGGVYSTPVYVGVTLDEIVTPPVTTTSTRPRTRMVIPRL